MADVIHSIFFDDFDDFDLAAFTDFGGGDDLDFDIADFDLVSDKAKNRYQKPKVSIIKQKQVIYNNAANLAKTTTIGKGERINAVVSGNFIFGDFIEAYIVNHNAKVPKMTISTLSLSQDNVDSLRNLLIGGFVDQLNLIISAYFYSHEKRRLIPYIYENLDIDGKRFQLAFATTGGKKIAIHGSANLRSSGNVEQFILEENAEIYDFFDGIADEIIDKYKTINHAIRHKNLREVLFNHKNQTKWHQDQDQEAGAAEVASEQGQPHSQDGQTTTHHKQPKARRFKPSNLKTT